MLKMKKVSETYDMKVFSDSGEYFGDVEESILTSTKIFGWKVKATKNSYLNKVLGSAKGVIVPHQLVKAVGDILIISKTAVPSYSAEESSSEAGAEEQMKDRYQDLAISNFFIFKYNLRFDEFSSEEDMLDIDFPN